MKYLLFISGIFLLSCATVPSKSKQPARVMFPAWIPFDYQISYSGDDLPEEVRKADQLLSQGRYESALLAYQKNLYSYPKFRRDLSHRVAASMILLRQPVRAIDFIHSIRERQHFQNAEGQLIRIKAFLDGRRIRQAVAESDKLLRGNPKPMLREKLRLVLSERAQTDLYSEDLKSEILKYQGLAQLVFPERFNQKKHYSAASEPSSISVAEQNGMGHICALLPLSGQLSNLGSKIAQGLSLRFEISQAGLQLLIHDVGSSGAEFQQNFTSLISRQKCVVFVGPFVSDQLGEFSVANKNQTFSVVLSRKPPATTVSVVHLGLTNRSQIITILNFLNSEGVKTVAVAPGPNQFSQDFASEFVTISPNFGIRPIPVVLEGFDDRSIENFERKLTSVSVDTVVLPLSPSETADLMLGLSDRAKASHQFIGTALLDDEMALSQSKNLFKGILFPSFFVRSRENQLANLFIETMTSKQLSGMVDAFSALGFEVGDILISAYESFGVINQETIAKTVQNRHGLLGKYTLDFFPSLERYLFLRKVE